MNYFSSRAASKVRGFSHKAAVSLAVGLVAGGWLALAAPAQAQTRPSWYQPFDGTSIWNTPIGSGATYSGTLGIGGGNDFADVDVEYQLRALPTDPTAVYGSYNGNPLSVLFPYYALPNKGVGSAPNGTTSLLFFSTAVNDYVFNQWQYWSRSGYGTDLSNVGNFQYGNYFGDFNDLRPTSGGESAGGSGTAFGAHGGSELSAVGGDMRLGEATSADPIRHVLKLNIDQHYLYPTTPNHASGDRAGNGYRWPAYKADSDPPPYSGNNPDLAQGSLLAIPPSVNINNLGLQTAFGMKIAWTLQNFGAYIVDNSGYTGDQLSLEQNAREEIEANYGSATYFASNVNSDLITLYQQLRVVTNNGSASIGGGGTPRVTNLPSLGPINNIPDGDYYIQNRTTGQVLNVWSDATNGGAPIYQYPLTQGATNEIFTVKHVGAGYYTLTGKHSGLLASIAGASQTGGALLEQDGIGTLPSGATGPADNQLWSFIPVDSSKGDYMLQVRHSGEVLDVPGSTGNNVQLDQYQANDTGAQRWSLISASSAGSTAFSTSFETGQPLPTWNNSPDTDYFTSNPSNVSGFVSSVGPECGVRSNGDWGGINANTGSQMLLAAGTANGGSGTFCYYKVFDLSGSPVTLTSTSTISYWINPVDLGDGLGNGRYIAVDFHCTDGTDLRDSGLKDSNGFSLHPNAGHGGSIALNTWTQISANLGSLAGKTIDRIWVGYDRPGSTGQYRAYIDDLNIDPPAAKATVATPVFSPGGGTYTGTQSVSLSETTSGASVYYTTDGSTPTASSTKYTSAISVAASKTLKAIGIESGLNNSAVATAAYIINAAPTYTKLTGTVIGTSGSYNNSGNTIAKAFDGSTATFFDAPSANGAWAGLDLGSGKAKRITQIKYAPRVSWESRMMGGVFQGSNDNATWTALYTVSGTPADGWTATTAISSTGSFRYVRYLSPSGSYGNVAEIEFDTSP